MIGARTFFALVADIRSVVGMRYWLYVGLVALAGLMEGASVVSVIPLLTVVGIGSASGDTNGTLGGLALAVVDWLGLEPTLVSLGIVVLAALTISALLFVLQAYLGANLQTAYVHRWQRRVITGMFSARWGYFLNQRQGDLINAVVTETQRLGGAFYQTGLLLTGMVHSLVFIVIAAILSPTTTILIVAGAALLFLVTRPVARRAYRIGVGISSESAALQSAAGELIAGAKLVKATGTELEAVRVLDAIADRLRRRFRANALDIQIVKAVFDFGAAALIAGVLIVNSGWFAINPAKTVVILAIFFRLMPKLSGVQQSAQWLTGSLAAVELLQATAAQADSETEVASREPLPAALRDGALAIALSGVHVHYGRVAAVSGVTLRIPAGACVALVGGSGAGKSTLVDAILGLVPVTAGAITIGGVPLEQLPLASLRRRIGYMGQDTVLYNSSIRDNILWGRSERSQDELDACVRVAGADGFIGGLRDGYETQVGDRGALLSGGERQRLGLARAALGTPGLLILDEATSALDAESERLVTTAVAALKGGMTVIIIAHRLSSVRIADTICVMEKGDVVEHGSWEELIRRRGRFHQLWSLQHTEEQGAKAHA